MLRLPVSFGQKSVMIGEKTKTLDGCIAKLAEGDATVNTTFYRELVM